MSATKWLALPIGTKVRRKSNGEITERDWCQDKDGAWFYYRNNWWMARWLFLDDEWELIEEKQDWLIQDTNGNLTKSDSFRMPKQGDKVQVRDNPQKEWSDPVYTFVCFHKNKVLAESLNWYFFLYEQWRFPTQEEVTLSDGNTYLVEERGGEKILKLK